MTEHLPIQRWQHLPECWAKHQSDPQAWCICDELQACEERVLNAAREVVEEMDLHGCHPYRFPDCNCLGPQVIAAIDALRKEN